MAVHDTMSRRYFRLLGRICAGSQTLCIYEGQTTWALDFWAGIVRTALLFTRGAAAALVRRIVSLAR